MGRSDVASCHQRFQSRETSRPIAAALMMVAQVQPNACMLGEFVRFPITFRSLVSRTTIMTSGGAKRPLRIAYQNSIFTALSPAKSNASPTSMDTAITA